MKKIFSFFILIILITSLTGCSFKSNKLENINSYAIYVGDLLNTFSINSNSPIISSEKTIDSIKIKYENEDTLLLKLITESININIELQYNSNNSLDKEELSKIISIITGDSLLLEEEKKLEEFLKNNENLEIEINNNVFKLEKNENLLIIKTKFD